MRVHERFLFTTLFLTCMLYSIPGSTVRVSLVNAGFEDGPTVCILPTAYGVWGYDRVTVVTAENGITPLEGSHMARFDNTLRCNSGAENSDIFQIINITSLAEEIATGTADFCVQYWVTRVPGVPGTTDTEFTIWLGAYSNDPLGERSCG